MSQHPEVENKIIAELDSLGLSITAERPHPRKMTFADLGKPHLPASHHQGKQPDVSFPLMLKCRLSAAFVGLQSSLVAGNT